MKSVSMKRISMKRVSAGDHLTNLLFYALLGVFVVICFYPIWYVLVASISDPTYVNSGALITLPRGVHFTAYKYAFDQPQLWIGYGNTLCYTFLGTLFGLCVCIPCGYALSRRDLPFRGLIMGVFVFTMYFSGGLIPTYVVINTLGLINTRTLLIILGSVSVYNIVLIRTFCQSSIPEELREAASIDGCSNTRFFFSIVLPLSKAILAVIALYIAVHHWNSYYMGLAPLMHYWRVCRRTDLSGLTIAGPRETVRENVDFTLRFVFRDELDACVTAMPRIVELGEGDVLRFGRYVIRAHAADHAVPALCYRIDGEAGGHGVGFTGDTRFQESLPGFFRDVGLLLHEVSLGAGPVDPVHNAACRHSSAQEAARVCRESGARRLLLTHCYEGKREAALGEACRLLNVPVDWATPGAVFSY